MSLTNQLSQSARYLLESVDTALGPSPCGSNAIGNLKRRRDKWKGNVYSTIRKGGQHPKSAEEGFIQAFDSLAHGVEIAMRNILILPVEE
eukprot:TRINITY_DN2434_c0_g1_i1.p2 TRINITY_DN2434_c0_g1~~TRINITY_DN2434_c0_g1_i1.p2  ORF type:complete len:90 (+),score=10.33 TRINITY_DN2434_c0_g1_i1:98-367(+)